MVNSKGKQGIQGQKGDSGSQIRNLSNSLLVNGACENGTISDWLNVQIVGTYKGLPKLQANVNTVANNINLFRLRLDALYCLECYEFSNASLQYFGIELYDENGDISTNGNVASPASLIYTTPFISQISADIRSVKRYFGGENVGNSSFSSSAKKGRFVSLQGTNNYPFSHVIIKEVEKGTPVPFTLPFLPDYQMVYDPTTNEVGLHVGGQITWFQSV